MKVKSRIFQVSFYWPKAAVLYQDIKVAEVLCCYSFIIQIFRFSAAWTYKMQNIFVFYCDGDVRRRTSPANTILTVRKCEHLRRKINVHLKIIPQRRIIKNPNNLALQWILFLSIYRSCCVYLIE